MQALVKTLLEPGNIELYDVPEPICNKDQIKIKIAFSSICMSDIHIWHSDIALRLNPPVTIGHEYAGIVVEVGKDVKRIKIGQRVSSQTDFSICGKCSNCKNGHENVCENKQIIGYYWNGCFTSYVVVPAKKVVVLPDSISLQEGSLCEPTACCVHGFYELRPIAPDETIGIIGPGGIGIIISQIAKAHGNPVTIIGKSGTEHRMKIAESLGIKTVMSNNLPKDKELFDIIFEASGSESGINLALQLAKRRGSVIQMGLGNPSKIDFSLISYKELFVLGSLGSKRSSWNTAIELLSNHKVQTLPLIQTVTTLDNWKEAFEQFERGEGLKTLFKIGEE
jgi:L-iditol 2-dehydrogenase